MKAKLEDIASIQIGYSFRSRLQPKVDGDLAIIQMKDLGADNTVQTCDLVKVQSEGMKEHHYVQKGDLVFRTRGLDTTSALIQEDVPHAVVAGPLLRIRLNDPKEVLPEFMNWYIAQQTAQAAIARQAEVMLQKMINKKMLSELEVVVPSLATQQVVVELAALAKKEQRLLRNIASKREQCLTAQLHRMVNGD